ncbi:MAG: hypothetical protein JO266_15280 [Acidobacteria bacterium]|nr:hypothetical protein [Acidobacteriota bacterium]
MRKFLLTGVAIVALHGAPATAQQAVTCVNCSTLVQQLLDYARQLDQLVQETTTAEQEILNTLRLPGTVYRDLTGDIAQLTGITSQANMLVGFSGQMLTNLSSDHGYPLGNISNWHQQISDESSGIALGLKTAATSINALTTALTNDAATLSQLQSQALVGSGRQQSLQTLAGLSASMAQSMQKLSQVMVTAAQGQMTYQTGQQDYNYMVRTVSDHDLEVSWVNEGAAVVDLGLPQ